MSPIRRFVSWLLGRGAVEQCRKDAEHARRVESDVQKRLVSQSVTTIYHAKTGSTPAGMRKRAG